MKRALVGIVPDELLNRKPKAFVPPEPTKDGSTEWPSMTEIGRQIVGSSAGIIDPNRFLEALQKARSKEEVHVHILRRTLTLESSLRHLWIRGVLSTKGHSYSSHSEQREGSLLAPLEVKELQASAQPKSSAS